MPVRTVKYLTELRSNITIEGWPEKLVNKIEKLDQLKRWSIGIILE